MPSRRLRRSAIHVEHPARMSHSAGPSLAISPTMGGRYMEKMSTPHTVVRKALPRAA
jgi:hypothetical protein